jgi:predicted Zn-dependent protease with MMP-like domain
VTNERETHIGDESSAPGYEFEDEDAGPEDEIVDRAWSALDEGDAKKALSELEQLDADWPARWIPETLARAELGDLRGARAVLDQARGMEGLDEDLDFLWAEGTLLLREWRVDKAREVLAKLALIERSAAVLERLSLCAELAGDMDVADGLLAEAAEVDPSTPAPPRLSEEEFAQVITSAIEGLPQQFREPIESTEIIVEPVPSRWMIDESDPSETPPDMLGLFVGASELDRSAYDSSSLPPRIFLFQRNIERASRDPRELVEETRVTLFHEIGHMLGFDEAGVAALGLE